jgi:uncharacterized protein involved in tolerance to divalent cations
MKTTPFQAGSPLRISFPVRTLDEGHAMLSHLVENRLVSGGTVVEAASLNWIGGEIKNKGKKEVTAYTTFAKLPLIRTRLDILSDGEEQPVISQFMMTEEKESTLGWIARNTR